MLPRTKQFDRGDHVLEITTTKVNGLRQISKRKLPKTGGPPIQLPPTRTAVVAQPAAHVPAVKRYDCRHCLGRTDENYAQTGCVSCGEKLLSIFECALFGDCAPQARGTITTPGVRKCLDCPQYDPQPGHDARRL